LESGGGGGGGSSSSSSSSVLSRGLVLTGHSLGGALALLAGCAPRTSSRRPHLLTPPAPPHAPRSHFPWAARYRSSRRCYIWPASHLQRCSSW
jgi:hypothetical protein